MEKELIFLILGLIIYLGSAAKYFYDILAWKTIPHPYSCMIWAIIFSISTGVLILNEEYIWSISGATATLVNGVWVYYGLRGRNKIPINMFDKSCLLLAIGSLIYGIISRDFFNTILLVILIDFLAFLPTLKKWWILPWSETSLSWFLSGIQYIFMIFTITIVSFETMGFWAYNIICTIGFAMLMVIRRYYLRWWHSIFE